MYLLFRCNLLKVGASCQSESLRSRALVDLLTGFYEFYIYSAHTCKINVNIVALIQLKRDYSIVDSVCLCSCQISGVF